MSSEYFDYVDAEVAELNAEEAISAELHQLSIQENGGVE